MHDIITFGSATKDIFIKTKNVKVLADKKKFTTGKGVCFGLGSKVEIDEMAFASGGGGTNTAVGFANQGFRVAYCGSLGNDLSAQEIINELKALNIDTGLIVRTDKKPTNHAIVIEGVDSDRTILVYRGASEQLEKEDILWDKIQAEWFYIAPLSGKLFNIFEHLLSFAVKNNIKVALNPGNAMLVLPPAKIKEILKKVDVLILNQEEASVLTKTPYAKEKQVFKKLDDLCPGIAIMTKGEMGATVSDGKDIYSAPALKTRVVDKTGAGDSFSSGFVSGYMQSNGDIVSALQLGIANSAACLKGLGAKGGLLKKGQKFDKVHVSIQPVKK